MSTETSPAQSREAILKSSLEAREQEVMHYQINIDNYAMALVEIDKMPMSEKYDLAKFTEQLQELLSTEKLEQKKAKIMLTVIQSQVE
jgi:hypothetical protein